MSMSLLQIETALSDLMEARAEVEAGETCPVCLGTGSAARCGHCGFKGRLIDEAALEQIDKAIVEYVTQEIRKVDNIARYIRETGLQVEAIKSEADRLADKARRLDKQRERVKAMVLQIMTDMNVKKLPGQIATLKRQGNGGVQPVEVTQPDLIPPAYKRVTITTTLDRLVSVLYGLMHDGKPQNWRVSEPEPDVTAIREALMKREPCPKCKGTGSVNTVILHSPGTSSVSWVKCDCEDGTDPAGVPGARLLERGEHLRCQ